MNDLQQKLDEAGALANAILFFAECESASHWPESARLLLACAARLARLHKETAAQLVRDSDAIAEGVVCAFHRERGRRACLATIGTVEN